MRYTLNLRPSVFGTDLSQMMQMYAHRFVELMNILHRTEEELRRNGSLAMPPLAPIDSIVQLTSEWGLVCAGRQAKRIQNEVSHQRVRPNEVGIMLGHLRDAIKDDLAGCVFLSVDQKKVEEFFVMSQEEGFLIPKVPAQIVGELVMEKFPSIDYDLRQAVRCYTLDANTACVLHLMRVLEVGLKVLAGQFKVDAVNWQNIINLVEKEIRSIGSDPIRRAADWPDQQAYYSAIATHFMFLKGAWRNHVVHGTDKYAEDQAREILRNVTGFMKKLAERLAE